MAVSRGGAVRGTALLRIVGYVRCESYNPSKTEIHHRRSRLPERVAVGHTPTGLQEVASELRYRGDIRMGARSVVITMTTATTAPARADPTDVV